VDSLVGRGVLSFESPSEFWGNGDSTNEPPDYPDLAADPVTPPDPPLPPRTRPDVTRRDGVGALAFFVVVEVVLAIVWYHRELPASLFIVLQWLFLPAILTSVAFVWPAGILISGDCPPIPPTGTAGEQWAIRLPGRSFGSVFLFALVSLGVLSCFVWRWTVAESELNRTLAITALWRAGSITIGLALRTRPLLEVDEAGGKLTWHPNSLVGRTWSIPFDAVSNVCVFDTFSVERVSAVPQIEWRTDDGRVLTKKLSQSADRERVELPVARLRLAVFGAEEPLKGAE
jgi:hypothetical protein